MAKGIQPAWPATRSVSRPESWRSRTATTPCNRLGPTGTPSVTIEVMERIQDGTGRQFDPQIVEAFVSLMARTGQPRRADAAEPTPVVPPIAS